MRDLPTLKFNIKEPKKFGNLAADLDQSQRRTLAQDLIALIKIDETSMNEWVGKARGYLEKVKREKASKPQNREQEGSGEEQPPSTEMTLTAVTQFSARATDALLGEPDLARASEPTPGALALAAWVSSQLRTKDPNWLLETDPLVVHMSVTGLAWRKRDFDDEEEAFHTFFRPSVDGVIINANVKSAERAPRITDQYERYPYEIERNIRRKKWVDYEPVYDQDDPQAPKKFYECDCWLDLDGDEIDEPWTVTISIDDTPEVVKLRPLWSKKTVIDTESELYFNPIRRFYPYRFLPSVDGSFFPMGFGELLDAIEATADDLLASITDTAKSEAENGGVVAASSGLPDKVELKGNRITAIPGLDGAPLTNRLQLFQPKQVSPGAVQVLNKVMTLGDRIAGTLNLMENAPASMTATLAKGLIDNGTQVQSAVHRRMVTSLTQEIHAFVRMADAYDQLPDTVSASDSGSVAVTADPQLATEMHRSALGSLYLQMIEMAAKGVPWSIQECQLRFGQIMRLPNPEKLIAPPQQPQATPDEKIKGMLGMAKQKTENIKVIGQVAVQLTQAMLNLVQASGGMQDQRMALLQMAQLEDVVKRMMEENSNANSLIDGMAQQPGNQNTPQLPPPEAGGSSTDVSGGAGAGGPADAGPGSGLA